MQTFIPFNCPYRIRAAVVWLCTSGNKARFWKLQERKEKVRGVDGWWAG